MYIGATNDAQPTARPRMKRAPIRNVALGANAHSSAPAM
jgi:hypothetical protein